MTKLDQRSKMVILEELRREYGMLTPEIVREAARPSDSPMHSYVFDRDVPEAAEEYYLSRAHDFIRTTKIRVIANGDKTPHDVRGYLAVPSGDNPDEPRYVYEPALEVRNNAGRFERVRLEAMRQLRGAESVLDDLAIIAHGSEYEEATERVAVAVRAARSDLEMVA